MSDTTDRPDEIEGISTETTATPGDPELRSANLAPASRWAEEAQPVIGSSRRRLSEGAIWQLHHDLNDLKVWILMLHLDVSTAEYIKKLFKLLADEWAKKKDM